MTGLTLGLLGVLVTAGFLGARLARGHRFFGWPALVAGSIPGPLLGIDAPAAGAPVHRPPSYGTLIERSPDLTIVVDAAKQITYATAGSAEMLGRPGPWLTGQPVAGLVHPADLDTFTSLLERARTEGADAHPTTSVRFSHVLGNWVDTDVTATDLRDDPAVEGLMLTVRDMHGRKEHEETLRRLALHDELTGLANRTLFREHVDHAMGHQRRTPVRHAVLFMDIDGFKTINDSLGHAAGDEVLVTVAQRILSRLRPSDNAARLGGDEFAILLENTSERDAASLAQRLLDVLRLPCLVQGRAVVLTASVGIAFTELAHDTEALLRNADVAMYRAKAAGKGHYALFEPEMHEDALERLNLEGELRRAVESAGLVLYYQPMVALEDGELVAMEALVRWQHPRLGLLQPSAFIGLAEDSDLILPMGRAILEEACGQTERWNRQFPAALPLSICVNVSVRQLEDRRFCADVAGALARSGLSPDCLSLEITESLFMHDLRTSVARLGELRDLGVSVAVDDFGTGYSSLSYLQDLPVDALKLDKSFVDGVCEGPERSALARAVIDLARTFGLQTIAEGIELPCQAAELRRLGARTGQGFYFSPPRDTAAMESFLHARGSPAPDARAVAGAIRSWPGLGAR